MMRRIMYCTTVSVLVAHVFFLFEALPYTALVCGFATHASYLWLLNDFPFFRLLSPPFLSSLALLVLSHFFWISHFLSHYHQLTHVLCFLLFNVWLVPFGFFISLSANESTLPDGRGGGLGLGGKGI